MRDQEIVGLYEAYQSIYEASPDQDMYVNPETGQPHTFASRAKMLEKKAKKKKPPEVKEEVEIAAQYFYEMGLNETGIEILIEELGVEEFAEWVYDIADSYVLNERKLASGETALPAGTRRRIGGSRAASRRFSDPTNERTAGGKRRAERAAARAAREEGETRETPRQARIRELRVKAATKAQEKQPQKQGFLGRIAGAVSAGIERDKKARENLGRAAQETGKVIGKAAKLAGGVAGEVVKGAGGAAGIMGHIARKGLKEEVETWVNSLVEEGYDLSDYTWDDMYEMYMNLDEEAPQTIKLPATNPLLMRNAGRARLHKPKKVTEETNLFNYLLEYLVAEGYADTNKAAINIMSHMSEEWKQSIVEEVLDEKKGERPRGLPYGPVGRGFRELTVPQRKEMMKKAKKYTQNAMNSDNEYSRDHAASSTIDSALRSRRLGGRG